MEASLSQVATTPFIPPTPYMLRWSSLSPILAFIAMLEIIILLAHILSRNLGLVYDTNCGLVLFVFQFPPILLAVVHIFLSSLILGLSEWRHLHGWLRHLELWLVNLSHGFMIPSETPWSTIY